MFYKKSLVIVLALALVFSFVVPSIAQDNNKKTLEWPTDQLGSKPDLSHLEGESIELNVWHFSRPSISFLTSIKDDFNSVYPNVDISIEIQQFPYDQLYDSLRSSLIGQTGAPDIVAMEINQTAQFFRPPFAGMFKEIQLGNPLDSNLLKQDPYTSSSGKLLGIESGGPHPSFLFYRKDLFDKAGIEMPIETWDEYIEAGLKMKKELGYPITMFPITASNPDFMSISVLAIQNGNPFYNKNGEFVLNNESGVEAFQLVKDMVYKHEIAADASPADPLAQQRLAGVHSDQIASIIAPLWYPSSRVFNKTDDSVWGVAPLPKFKDTPYRTSTWGGTGLSIVESQSEYPEVAEAFLKYSLTDENQINKFKDFEFLPVVKSALNSEEVREYKKPEVYGDQAVGEIYYEYTQNLPPFRFGEGATVTLSEIDNRLNELEDMDVKEWLDSIEEYNASQLE